MTKKDKSTNIIDTVIKEVSTSPVTPKESITYSNAQASSKWNTASIIFEAPAWLKAGDYAGFQADHEIDHNKAFKALANYASQHLPVSLRGKANPSSQAIYYWLAGAYVAAPRMSDAEYRTYLIATAGLAKAKVDGLTNSKAKALAVAHRDLAILTADNAAIASVEGEADASNNT